MPVDWHKHKFTLNKEENCEGRLLVDDGGWLPFLGSIGPLSGMYTVVLGASPQPLGFMS